ncbi:MAG: von Willebrand factor type A domain-containing protein [Lachnospiraceae bacterium]|nr:von Willebrand factor type A domain-containing protein [Lachnospiraceae bacterium]
MRKKRLLSISLSMILLLSACAAQGTPTKATDAAASSAEESSQQATGEDTKAGTEAGTETGTEDATEATEEAAATTETDEEEGEKDIDTLVEEAGKLYDGYTDSSSACNRIEELFGMVCTYGGYEKLKDPFFATLEEFKVKLPIQSEITGDINDYTVAILPDATVIYYKLKDSEKIVRELEKIENKLYDKIMEFEEDEYREYATNDMFAGKGGASRESAGMAMTAPEESFVAEDVEEGGYAESYEEPTDEPADFNTEEYSNIEENRFLSTKANPFSTFGMDVDTATYSNLRRLIMDGSNLPSDSIRTEEMVNYFNYNYPDVKEGEKFSVTTEISDCPWNEDTQLLKVGVRAENVNEKPDSNIVLLVDVSGSMFWNHGLKSVQKALILMAHQFDRKDRISLVTYAGEDAVVLDSVEGSKMDEIIDAIAGLENQGGGTNGAAGINTAYELAEKNFIEGGNNRVILATDGDLNVGVTSEADLINLIKEKKETGVFLSVIGVGEDNYKDNKMESLADNGNGNYSFIDSIAEAKKVLINEIDSTLYTVAKDAKMQIEFNPGKIKGYRQIGYENRQMKAEDFADDTKDGAEIGSGQTVTVLYEIVPVDSKMEIPEVESKYGSSEAAASDSDELMTVSIRYKEPDKDKSELLEYPVTEDAVVKEMSPDTAWAANVAQVAMLLRDSQYKGTSDYEQIIKEMKANPDVMDDKYKIEFIYMTDKVKK